MQRRHIFFGTVVLLALAWAGWRLTHRAHLWVVNPLGRPLTATIDGRVVTVPAESAVDVDGLTRQPVLVVVTIDTGEPVDSVIALPVTGQRVEVYAVMGLAPVFSEEVSYVATAQPGPAEVVHCGKRLIDFERVDDVFVEPPETVSVVATEPPTPRVHVGLHPGGVGTCVSLSYRDDFELDEVAVNVADMLQGIERQDRFLSVVAGLANQGEFAASAAMVERALRVAPTELELHRLRYALYRASGALPSLHAEYDARAALPDAGVDDVYLASLGEAPDAALQQLSNALRRAPSSPWLHLGAAQALVRLGRDAEALSHFTALDAALPPLVDDTVARAHVATLRRLGKMADAERVLARFTELDASRVDVWFALLHRDVAKAAGRTVEVEATLSPLWAKWLASFDGRQTVPEMDLPVLARGRALSVLALRDPTQALNTTLTSSPRVLRVMPPLVRLWLTTEAWRLQDTAAAARLEPTLDVLELPPVEEIRAFVEGGVKGPAFNSLDESQRGVWWLARARRLPAGPAHDEAQAEADRWASAGGPAAEAAKPR